MLRRIKGRNEGYERTRSRSKSRKLPVSEIPVGTRIRDIDYVGKGGQLVRSAGNSAQLMAKEGKYATLIPSGEMRIVAQSFAEHLLVS